MKILLVLQLICLVFLGGGQAETQGADIEGSSYAQVEEILLEAQVEQLTKENLNLFEKIQIQDKQLENMRTLEVINKNLQQENIENMEKNQNLRAENTFQANEIVQLKEKLQSKETMLQNNLTKTIQDLHNATVQARKFESLLQAELQSKSTHKEDAHLERQRHEITKQELEDLKTLVKMSMNLTRIQNKRTSQLENITASMDMDKAIRKMKEKEILYLTDIQAYQNEILILQNATHEENDQKERLKIAITQQNKLEESNERMLRFLTSVIVNMTTSIHNCSTITTDAQQVQLDALQEKEDTMKQLITQCSMFNASSIDLQNHYIQVNSQLKDQLEIKNNVIRQHIEENKEHSNDLEETKQLTKIQSEALEIMTEEMERFIPDNLNSRTIVRRSADGTIKSASLCQCIPATPGDSELELTSIHWSCPSDKAIIKNGSQIENTISLPCSVSDCSVEESSWPQCEDVLEKSWTPWEYLSCKEMGAGNETILCGGGHRSRSRQVRSSSANPWKSEDVTEHCKHCSLSFASILGGQKMTITPPELRNALNNSMDISNPIHNVVLKKSWTPWEYLSCTEICVGNETILCGTGHRSRSRGVRSSSANPWRNESVTEQCQNCSLSFASISGGQKMTITPPVLENALNNSMDIANPIPPIPCSGCINGIKTADMTIEGRPVVVSCEDSGDMFGAWTVIQRRGQYGNPEDHFSRVWTEYENGFGSTQGEVWLGLRSMAALTKEGEWELQVDLRDWDGKLYMAAYRTFSVGNGPRFELSVSGFNDSKSTLGDSLAYHSGRAFTTKDRDQDETSNNCAITTGGGGGWWYGNCDPAGLNGLNFNSQRSDDNGIEWNSAKESKRGSVDTWKESTMKIRKVQ